MSAFPIRFFKISLFCSLSLLFTPTLAAQNTAARSGTTPGTARPANTPKGTVRDSMVTVRGIFMDREENARMTNVRVFFTHRTKRGMIGVLANDKGEFSRKIAPGYYDIEAQFTGKAILKLENYRLMANGSYFIRIEMGASESKAIIERRK